MLSPLLILYNSSLYSFLFSLQSRFLLNFLSFDSCFTLYFHRLGLSLSFLTTMSLLSCFLHVNRSTKLKIICDCSEIAQNRRILCLDKIKCFVDRFDLDRGKVFLDVLRCEGKESFDCRFQIFGIENDRISKSEETQARYFNKSYESCRNEAKEKKLNFF